MDVSKRHKRNIVNDAAKKLKEEFVRNRKTNLVDEIVSNEQSQYEELVQIPTFSGNVSPICDEIVEFENLKESFCEDDFPDLPDENIFSSVGLEISTKNAWNNFVEQLIILISFYLINYFNIQCLGKI